jgi:putative addiction module antidote
MDALELTEIGDSLGVILPPEALTKLGLGVGDTVYATAIPDGLALTAVDPAATAALEVARGVMRDRRAVLGELAK